ncbi:MAG TPA: BACON domain-containing carbohydrate-binding protein [Vicinamibacterales bacterium]|nr:BACON domain-containing carbohydrate-binding protein [Vicinamibacterales bacterium]
MGPRAKYLALCFTVLAALAIFACDSGTPIQPSCIITIDPASLAFTSAGGSGAVTVSTSASQCTWTAAASVPWITVTAGASGTGPGTVKYTVSANATSQARTGVVAIGGQVHNVAQDGQGACAYDVTPLSATFNSAGGQGTLTVSTTAACSWTATTSETWLTIVNGSSGEGGGTVTYAVGAYAGTAARTAVIHVAGYDVQVTQSAPGCSFAVSPQSAAFSADAGEGTIDVSAPAGCTWTASTNDTWLLITRGTSGQGNGTVVYSVAKQTTADVRAGTIRVAGVDVRVVQSGDVSLCQYSVAPVTFTPCMPATTLTTTMTTGTSCPWTASASVSWLTIAVGQSGTGPGAITFSTSDNYDAPRTGVIMVRWPTPTAGQNVQVAQAGCHYSVPHDQFPFFVIKDGAPDLSFDVLQQSLPEECGGVQQEACVWSAASDYDWITITTHMPVRGDKVGPDGVHFTVAPNNTGGNRQGTIRVKDKVVTIIQSGS